MLLNFRIGRLTSTTTKISLRMYFRVNRVSIGILFCEGGSHDLLLFLLITERVECSSWGHQY